MNRLVVNTLLGVLLGFCGATAQASDDKSAAIESVIPLGPGPVINPENSQYMEEKKAVMAKQVQQHQAKKVKHHSEKKHLSKSIIRKSSN